MKKTLLAATAMVALNLFAAQAKAADPVEPVAEREFYVSLFGGASFLNDIETDFYDSTYEVGTKTGYILGGAIGARLWDPVRGEIEVSYSRWKADDFSSEPDDGGTGGNGPAHGDVEALYILGNLWYDFNTDTMFTPYVGAGAGAGIVDADTTFDDSDFGYGNGGVGFAFQLGGGLRFGVTENIALDLGYRFKGVLDVGFEDSDGQGMYSGGDLYSHNIQGGVTFGFPGMGAMSEPSEVFDGTGFYVSLFGGASFLQDLDTNYFDSDTDYTVETKTGYIIGGAIGKQIWDPVRAEVEVSYARWKADEYSSEFGDGGSVDGDIEALYILGNLWYDINTDTAFTPYAGGGIGIAVVDADTTFDGNTFGYGDGETGFAFQLGGGVQFGLTENIALDVGYRFKGVLDVEFQDSDGGGVYAQGDLWSHNVQGGVKIGF